MKNRIKKIDYSNSESLYYDEDKLIEIDLFIKEIKDARCEKTHILFNNSVSMNFIILRDETDIEYKNRIKEEEQLSKNTIEYHANTLKFLSKIYDIKEYSADELLNLKKDETTTNS